jgi:hypothetical protein
MSGPSPVAAHIRVVHDPTTLIGRDAEPIPLGREGLYGLDEPIEGCDPASGITAFGGRRCGPLVTLSPISGRLTLRQMTIEWIDYWPAVRHRRFWAALGRVIVLGAATGALFFAAMMICGTLYDKLFAGAGAGFDAWLDSVTGTSWIWLLVAFWLGGSLFYAALGIFHAEAASDAIEQLRHIKIRLGASRTYDGHRAFAEYGNLMNVRMKGEDWIDKVRGQIAFGVAELADDYPYAVNAGLWRVIDVLRSHRLITTDTAESVDPKYRDYFLTLEGEAELSRARARLGLES